MKKIILMTLFLLVACQNKDKAHQHSSHQKFDFKNKEAKEIHKIAYSLGRQYAINMQEFHFDNESLEVFIQGLQEGHSSGEAPSKEMIFQAKKIDKRVQESRAEKAKDKKSEGETFIKSLLASDDTYKQTPSGLVYKIIKDGTKIDKIESNALFTMKYEGKRLDNSVYESALQGNPRKFPYGGVFKAWQEAFQLCGKGCEIEIISPSSLTYGDNGSLPKISPGEFLKYKLFFIDYFPQGI